MIFGEKFWCQQNSTSVSRDLYIFWVFFRWSITFPTFVNVEYFSSILEQPKKFNPSELSLHVNYGITTN